MPMSRCVVACSQSVILGCMHMGPQLNEMETGSVYTYTYIYIYIFMYIHSMYRAWKKSGMTLSTYVTLGIILQYTKVMQDV